MEAITALAIFPLARVRRAATRRNDRWRELRHGHTIPSGGTERVTPRKKFLNWVRFYTRRP